MKYRVLAAAAMALVCTAAFYSSDAFCADEAPHAEPAAQAADTLPGAAEPLVDSAEQARKEYALGMMMINHNKYDSAAEHLEKAISLDPKSYNSHIMLGKVYTRIKRHMDSIKTFWAAVKLEPDKVEAYDLLMQLYLYLHRPEKALETANVAMKAGIADTDLPDLGWSYYQVGKLDEAEAVYNKVIKKYGESFGVLRNLGILYFARGDYEKSDEYYEKAQKLDENNKILPYLKALTFYKLEKLDHTAFEVETFKYRDKNYMMSVPKYEKLYFPHTEVPKLNDYLFLLKGAKLDDEPSSPDKAKGAEGQEGADDAKPEAAAPAPAESADPAAPGKGETEAPEQDPAPAAAEDAQ